MKARVAAFLLGLTIALFSGCEADQKPRNLVPEDTYVRLLAEMQLVQTYAKKQNLDSLGVDSMIRDVFAHYRLSREQFRQSHAYYREQPEAQKERIDKAIEQLRMDLVRDTTRHSPTQ